jgi:hypothetical protein
MLKKLLMIISLNCGKSDGEKGKESITQTDREGTHQQFHSGF